MEGVFTKDKRAEYKLVGVSLPPDYHNYLSLFALAKSSHKSKILKMLIDNWITQQKSKGDTEHSLIVKVGQHAQDQFKVRKQEADLSLTEFKKILTEELEGKGISEKHIKLILLELNKK